MFSIRSRKVFEKSEDPFIADESDTHDLKEKSSMDKKKGAAYQLPDFSMSSLQDKFRLALITSFSLYLRIMKLGFPAYITESELETARHINWYMAGKFFLGKFPPLSSLICAALARLAGYYGSQDLTYPGQPFTEFPLVALRRLSATLGAALIPISYVTIRSLGHSRSTATVGASLLMLENGLITQSRYATPEIYVLFFGALATCSWNLMYKHAQESQGQPLLSTKSGLYQVLTGLYLGCAISSKWTGALTIPVILAMISSDTWNKLSDRRNNVALIFKRLVIQLLCISTIPVIVYAVIFQLHFSLIQNTGDHDLLLSPHLKYSLEGNELDPSQLNIAYGSQIVIKHVHTPGGYLHSHKHSFSGGSTQQEVTLYPYVDLGNIWTVHKPREMWNSSQPVEIVRNTDQIRLEHFASTRKLHSHDHRPQLSNRKEHSEVTAYGDKLIQDNHDFWTLQILDEENKPNRDKTVMWESLNQKFRLQHVRGCTLVSHNAFYAPPDGHNHQEVTCMSGAGTHISPWVIESSYSIQLEDEQTHTYDQISYYKMFKEVHEKMWRYPLVVYDRLQAGTTSDGSVNPKNRNDESPNRWFLKRASHRIWSELAGYSAHFVLNPVVQLVTICSVLVYLSFLSLSAFLAKRQIKLPSYLAWLNSIGLDTIANGFYTKSIVFYLQGVIVSIGCLRFFPSYSIAMPDILSCIYYGTGLSAVLLEACTVRLNPFLRRALLYGLLFAALVKFSHLSHLAYGGEKWFRNQCMQSGLDIDCVRFPPHETELIDILENSGKTQNSTLLTIYIEMAGATEPFRYNQGEEEDADRSIAILKGDSFQKELEQASGIYRYHRVVPTPGITIEEAEEWSGNVFNGAVNRQASALAEAVKTAQEAASKSAELARSERKEKQKKRRMTQSIDGGPVMSPLVVPDNKA